MIWREGESFRYDSPGDDLAGFVLLRVLASGTEDPCEVTSDRGGEGLSEESEVMLAVLAAVAAPPRGDRRA